MKTRPGKGKLLRKKIVYQLNELINKLRKAANR